MEVTNKNNPKHNCWNTSTPKVIQIRKKKAKDNESISSTLKRNGIIRAWECIFHKKCPPSIKQIMEPPSRNYRKTRAPNIRELTLHLTFSTGPLTFEDISV